MAGWPSLKSHQSQIYPPDSRPPWPSPSPPARLTGHPAGEGWDFWRPGGGGWRWYSWGGKGYSFLIMPPVTYFLLRSLSRVYISQFSHRPEFITWPYDIIDYHWLGCPCPVRYECLQLQSRWKLFEMEAGTWQVLPCGWLFTWMALASVFRHRKDIFMLLIFIVHCHLVGREYGTGIHSVILITRRLCESAATRLRLGRKKKGKHKWLPR